MKGQPFSVALVLVFFAGTSIVAGATGKIVGVVKDAQTGEPLPGANVFLQGTALGAASNLKGEYLIPAVPVGDHMLVVSYIGYKKVTVPINVAADQITRLDITLQFEIIEGEAIEVTAQMEGQVRAINQQLTSRTISNVVSAERIQELPDANAAESVGRLPGISIRRSGGEGNKVVIRGLAPTYNTITIGGVKVPATDLDDRSVDLNMISPEILAGIDVTKALTPDKDAEAFGGVVNFALADAPKGGFKYDLKFKSGYNAQREDLGGPYKGSLTLSNRFAGEKLGIMIAGNLERAQRGSDQFAADYIVVREKREGEEFAPIRVEQVDFAYADEIRKRLGFNVLMDYQLPNGKLMLSNFMSRLDRNELIHSARWDEGSNTHEIRLEDRQRQIDVLSNSFAGEHHLFTGNLEWRISRTASLNRHPFDSRIRARELSAFDQSKLPNAYGPDVLLAAANNDFDNMFLYQGDFFTEKALERDQSAQFNYELPFALANKIAGSVKFGGKYVNKLKERDRGYRNRRLDFTAITSRAEFLRHHPRSSEPGFNFIWLPNGWASMQNYLDPTFAAKDFLDGRHDFGPGLSREDLNFFLNHYLLDSLYATSSLADLDDYEATESVTAAYFMTEINWGRFLMLLPGARYEYTRAELTGRQGIAPNDFAEPDLDRPYISDTTATATYGRWFPMIHARVRPTNWFDIRLAYTKSLSRPRLDQMLPKKKVHSAEKAVDFGRPDLKPQISANFDIFLSVYSNAIGLFTLGGFYKEIDDLIFRREGHLILDPAKEGVTPDLDDHILNQPENNPFLTTVRGFEVEWQTNFRWLPRPLDGIVINANYSHIWSKTNFPRSFVLSERIPVFPFLRTSVVDTFRTGDMPDQSDDIANLAFGYDKGPLSARLSLLYQGKTLAIVGERPELDGFTADLLRMDLSLKYRLFKNFDLFFNWNNITNEPDEAFQSRTDFLTASEYYGWTMDLGVGFKL